MAPAASHGALVRIRHALLTSKLCSPTPAVVLPHSSETHRNPRTTQHNIPLSVAPSQHSPSNSTHRDGLPLEHQATGEALSPGLAVLSRGVLVWRQENSMTPEDGVIKNIPNPNSLHSTTHLIMGIPPHAARIPFHYNNPTSSDAPERPFISCTLRRTDTRQPHPPASASPTLSTTAPTTAPATAATQPGGLVYQWQSHVRSMATAPKKAKEPKKGGPGGAAQAGAEKNARDILLEACLKGQLQPLEPLDAATLAEEAALAKEYSRLMMSAHRKGQTLMSARLKYKLAAIDAIPEGKLKEAAMEPDVAPAPDKMYAPSLTPPVESAAEDLIAARSKPVKKIR